MHRVEEVVQGEEGRGIEGMLTIKQLAKMLTVSYSRAAAIIQETDLPFRYATQDEENMLFERGFIEGLPATAPPGKRVKLLPIEVVNTARQRRKRGWQKGVSRSKKDGC